MGADNQKDVHTEQEDEMSEHNPYAVDDQVEADIQQDMDSTPEEEAMEEQKIIYVNSNEILVENRQRQVLDDLSVLRESIAREGLIHPIVVQPVNGHYRLLAGGRRLEACRELKWNTVPCIVLHLDHELQIFDTELLENIARKKLNDMDMSDALTERKALYQEKYPQTQSGKAQVNGMNRKLGHNVETDSVLTFEQDTANRTGMSASTIKDYLRLQDLTPEQKEQLRAGTLNKSNALKLVRKPRRKEEDADQQESSSTAEELPVSQEQQDSSNSTVPESVQEPGTSESSTSEETVDGDNPVQESGTSEEIIISDAPVQDDTEHQGDCTDTNTNNVQDEHNVQITSVDDLLTRAEDFKEQLNAYLPQCSKEELSRLEKALDGMHLCLRHIIGQIRRMQNKEI